MKKILISSFDMEVGGVERSLISLLNKVDYQNFTVDLMLYKHQGDFLRLIPKEVNLLNEVSQYATFRKSIKETIKDTHFALAISRLLAKYQSDFVGKKKRFSESGYYQMQLMWRYSLPFSPKLQEEYDVAISYLWPHYFIAEKVRAKRKIAWIHTDYSTVETDVELDVKMWKQFDQIVAVSEACKQAFLQKYNQLKEKVVVIENITSPEFIKSMAAKKVDNPMMKDNRFKMITVARLSYAKGIDNAVHALKILKDKGYENIAWYVVGYGGDEWAIKKLIKETKLEDSFILLGKKTNPYPYIKEADIYVQPSRYEGKAVTVTEAMVLNKPILITNYPTAKSQVDDGETGIICNMSLEGLASGIERLILSKDLMEKLKRNTTKMTFNDRENLLKFQQLICS